MKRFTELTPGTFGSRMDEVAIRVCASKYISVNVSEGKTELTKMSLNFESKQEDFFFK